MTEKYLAIGHHGEVDAEEGRRIGEAAMAWIQSNLDDGTFECCYSMDGGGRVVILPGTSADDVLALLASGPDVDSREWSVVRVRDAVTVIREYLEAV